MLETESNRKKAYALRLVCLFFLCALLIPSGLNALENDYLQKIRSEADARELHEDPYWLTLLHFKPAANGYESLVDDPRFFLARDGKINPRSELMSALERLLDPTAVGEDAFRCRFPARYEWITERLAIDERNIPAVSCKKVDEAIRKIDPRHAVLVYPAPHIQNPSTMFGHTLLRIDSDPYLIPISHAVNYAAVTPSIDKNLISYVYNGLTGGFHAFYSILPYFQKIKEYNDMEERDLWEFHLNLDSNEVRRLILHVLELQDIYSEYFFFSENCSFNLLFLIEAARPGLKLTPEFWNRSRPWAIPSETIEAVNKAGLISGVDYRPALVTRINQHAFRSSPEIKQTALDLSSRPAFRKIPEYQDIRRSEDKIRALEVAAQLVQYRYSRLELDQGEFRERFVHLINEKKKLESESASTEASRGSVPFERAPAPTEGHLPTRISLGGGFANNSFFTEFGLRPVNHDLDDPQPGYREGIQLNLLDTAVRYYEKNNVLRLQRLSILDLVALAPQTTFLKPASWKLKTGLERRILRDGDEHLVYALDAGAGIARKSALGLAYGMIELDAIAGDQLENKVDLGVGTTVGVLKQISGWWQIDGQLQWIYYGLSQNSSLYRASAVQTFILSRDTSLMLQTSLCRVPDAVRPEIKLSWNYYF